MDVIVVTLAIIVFVLLLAPAVLLSVADGLPVALEAAPVPVRASDHMLDSAPSWGAADDGPIAA